MPSTNEVTRPALRQVKSSKLHCKSGHELFGANMYLVKSTTSVSGLSRRCRTCNSANLSKARKGNATYLTRLRTRPQGPQVSKYGLTKDQYHELLAKQGGVCAVCEEPPTRTRLSVDHDHVTGQIRGLLCSTCNFALGHAKDSATLLRKMADYLEESRAHD